jgi:hypothetical protein
MGMITKYELTASQWPDKLTKFIADDMKFYGINPDGSSSDSCKWYSHEHDMKILSLVFPEIHFTLHGEGEESGDIWKKHFINGKKQVCKAIITFPSFDPDKLQ